VASRRTTQTGPSHGPGMRTTNSSPYRSGPSAPRVSRNTAISGEAWFSFAATLSMRMPGLMRESAMFTAYRQCRRGPTPALRFYLGVRVTGVFDETRDTAHGPERVWGWCYQTL
jgi:hypothetical protein